MANGVMQEIRDHFADGKSSGEIIALGYAPPTVYKVQRLLRETGQVSTRSLAVQRNGHPHEAEAVQVPVDGNILLQVLRLETKNEELTKALGIARQRAEEADDLESEMDEAVARTRELESRVASLQNDKGTLEIERHTLATKVGTLEAQVRTLEGQLRDAFWVYPPRRCTGGPPVKPSIYCGVTTPCAGSLPHSTCVR